MKQNLNRKIEFGDFQTPFGLALKVCRQLRELGIRPNTIIEPTCGLGAFVLAAAQEFTDASSILGFDINDSYLQQLYIRLRETPFLERVHLQQSNFFSTDWQEKLRFVTGELLIIGNFPWVNNATQGVIGGFNLPKKSNFLGFNGFDAISGKANFDISEWMLLETLDWLKNRSGCIAMLVKTAVARKVLAHCQRQALPLVDARIVEIDAKESFNATVDACLLIMNFGSGQVLSNYDYTVSKRDGSLHGLKSGHRNGLMVSDIPKYEKFSFLIGESPQRWRSGVKHDASSVMEFRRTQLGLENGLGETADLEPNYIFPLLKGSDVGNARPWNGRFVLVTQRVVGETTAPIRHFAPRTWEYLERHGDVLDARASTIYMKNPRFSIFGIGDYAFRPWRVAICGLYKKLCFHLVGPVEEKPVMFDDTVYYLSFDSQQEAESVLEVLNSAPATDLLTSLIFWDDKRPIKTGILNLFDWTRFDQHRAGRQPAHHP